MYRHEHRNQLSFNDFFLLALTPEIDPRWMRVLIQPDCAAVTARKDDATAAVQAATTNVAGWDPSSGGGGLIQTTSGRCQQRVDRDHRRGFL
jgi:hypothetical protein